VESLVSYRLSRLQTETWLDAVIIALSVLVFLHSDLLVANQPHRDPSQTDPMEVALVKGRSLRKAGNFPAALSEFEHALSLARQQQNSNRIVRSLMLVATVQFLLFQYRSASTAAREALEVAQSIGDYQLAGGASGTIASIYRQLGDFGNAETEGQRTISLLKLAPPSAPQTLEFEVRALYVQASLCYLSGKVGEGETFFRQAIKLANQLDDKSLEASAWDDRGVACLRQNQFSLAEQSLNSAFALRQALHDSDTLPISQEHLAELELKRSKPNYRTALRLIDQALSSDSISFKTDSQYYPIHVRGQILLALGQRSKALKDFRRAVQAATVWRQSALPGDTTNTRTVAELHDVYSDFAHLAAQTALETKDSALRNEALETLAINRAASLREQMKLELATNFSLPAAYFEKLFALQAAQARVTLGANRKTDETDLVRIRSELDTLENKIQMRIENNFPPVTKGLRRNSVRDIQSKLGKDQLLLSFSLGNPKSYLWALTESEVDLYQLDGRKELEKSAALLSKAARDGGNINDIGGRLGQALFGVLQARLSRKPEWLIVADAALLNAVPFAAIPASAIHRRGGWLIEQHSLRFLPSAILLLSPHVRNTSARFIGVADPVYNSADARLNREESLEADMHASSVTLARLAGSRQEVLSSAQSSGLLEQQILEGRLASIEGLRKALADPPLVLHFAVHVVSPPNRPEEAALALSLEAGVPELLTQEAIATFRLAGALVVMNGCSSNQGKSVPSAGLLGLSRAFLLAGADAVIASSWPTPDDSGRFFSCFYGHFHATQASSVSQRAALALALTQREMQHGGGYTSAPSYWAAYSVISRD
jgi:tetratricopeptide (TPR) repeat protein